MCPEVTPQVTNRPSDSNDRTAAANTGVPTWSSTTSTPLPSVAFRTAATMSSL